MEALRLAIEMLDRVDEAHSNDEPLNPAAEAKRLVRRHPEADVSRDDVEEALRDEIAAAGGSIM